MNIAENMVRLQRRLIERGARPQTVRMLDKYITLAERAGGSEHSTGLRVLQRLMRAPEATQDTAVYNDLVGLEEELEGAREQSQRERELLESKPLPKLKKYYKQHKDKR